MKKFILFLSALILLSVLTNAQSSGGKCYDENTRLINVGFGLFGGIHKVQKASGYTSLRTPAISVSYEQPWPKRLGPGYLGVGGYLGHQLYRSKYEYTSYEYSNSLNNYVTKNYYSSAQYNDILLCARAVYHWDGLIAEKAQVYGGIMAGVRLQTYSYSSDDPGLKTSSSSFGGYFAHTLLLGARYYPWSKFGFYGELSYGMTYATLGATIKI